MQNDNELVNTVRALGFCRNKKQAYFSLHSQRDVVRTLRNENSGNE